jgi:hypothetical protein
MGFLAPFIPAAASLLGGILTHKGESDSIKDRNAAEIERQRLQDERDRQAQQARYDMGRNVFERNATGQAVRGGVGGGLLSKWFNGLDQGQLEKLRTPTAYPDFEFRPGGQVAAETPQPGWAGFAGGVLSGIAPYLGGEPDTPQNAFEKYLSQHPNFAAQQAGQTYGPPGPVVGALNPEIPEGIDPFRVNPNAALGGGQWP